MFPESKENNRSFVLYVLCTVASVTYMLRNAGVQRLTPCHQHKDAPTPMKLYTDISEMVHRH